MKPYLPIAIVMAAFAAAPAQAAAYKITQATHTSSSTKSEPGYQGSSTVTWRLARPSRINIQANTGLAALKLKGAEKLGITTDWPGRCAWDTPFADAFELMVTPGRVSLNMPRASLSDGYLGTECSTSISGEPSPTQTSSKVVPPSTFRKRTVKLTLSGAAAQDRITYRWSTKLTLRRAR